MTDVSIIDGEQRIQALTFFTVHEGRITRMVEFWPEPYTAPANRAHLVEVLTPEAA